MTTALIIAAVLVLAILAVVAVVTIGRRRGSSSSAMSESQRSPMHRPSPGGLPDGRFTGVQRAGSDVAEEEEPPTAQPLSPRHGDEAEPDDRTTTGAGNSIPWLPL